MLFVQRCDSVFLCTKLGVYFLLHKFCCLKKIKTMSEIGGDRMLCSADLGMLLGYRKKKHCLSCHNG